MILIRIGEKIISDATSYRAYGDFQNKIEQLEVMLPYRDEHIAFLKSIEKGKAIESGFRLDLDESLNIPPMLMKHFGYTSWHAVPESQDDVRGPHAIKLTLVSVESSDGQVILQRIAKSAEQRRAEARAKRADKLRERRKRRAPW